MAKASTTTSKKREALPNLANATPGFLADELGRTRAQKSKIEKLEGTFKEALKAKLRAAEETEAEGEEYSATITEQSRTTIDTAAIRADMGDDWISKYERTTEFDVVRTKRLD